MLMLAIILQLSGNIKGIAIPCGTEDCCPPALVRYH